ncbi:MAG: lactoylglutathione lyase [Chlorobi bacterium]|nr:lactoylglutathione lyase [Chlorobiota bacterium]
MQKIEFIIYVKNQKISTDFYTFIFGHEPVLNVPGMTEFQINDFCKLGIMPEKSIEKILENNTPNPVSGSGIPRCEIYLMVDEPQQYFEKALKAGAISVSPPKARDWNHIVAYVADPDGHIIAFAKEN